MAISTACIQYTKSYFSWVLVRATSSTLRYSCTVVAWCQHQIHLISYILVYISDVSDHWHHQQHAVSRTYICVVATPVASVAKAATYVHCCVICFKAIIDVVLATSPNTTSVYTKQH
jgi:hypothetical protein